MKRPNYFSGKLLSAEDLQEEQNYNLKKRRLHNRCLHGWGIAAGLEVATKGGRIEITAGLAIDCVGNEIVVPNDTVLDCSPDEQNKSTLFVGVQYHERLSDPVPSDSGSTNFAYIEECYRTFIMEHNANRGHRHSKGRWCACGEDHPITLARLTKRSQGWTVDRRYQPPKIK